MSSSAIREESPRRGLSAKQVATVERLTDAAHQELRAVGFDELTVRSTAARAQVAPATAYTYFGSKNHLVAETFWRRLMAQPRATPPPDASTTERVVAVTREMTDFLSRETDLAAAATPALLGSHPDVQVLRERLGREYGERFREALGDEARPAVLEALGLAFSGAMLQAGMGFMSYDEMGDRLADVIEVILEGAT